MVTMNHIADKTNVFRDTLLHEIAAGRYRPQEKLPSERLFCERYHISRTTARRALDELEGNGIIVRRPPTGAFVQADALERLSCSNAGQANLSVAFIMPPDQLNNPVIEMIFSTCRRYLDNQVKFSVIFNSLDLPINLRGVPADVAVVHGIHTDEQLRILEAQVNTMVLLNTRDDQYNYITADNYGGGRLMAEYILQAGHHSIGCVGPGGKRETSDFEQRYQGVADVCNEAGVRLEHHVLSVANSFDLSASCHQALDNLLLRQPQMSAVLGIYDLIAIYLCESLHLRGVRIPEDMSVMGFDDQFYAGYTVPPLTTVKYPAEAVGMKLAQFIRDLKDGKTSAIQEIIKPLLVERRDGSVKVKDSGNAIISA